MNRAVLRRFPSTAVALGFALVVMLAAIVWGVNVFRLPWVNIIGIEQSEIGAVVLAYLLVVPAFFMDRAAARRRGHEIQGHAERQQAHAASVRAQQSLDSADVILLALDLGGQITLVNRKACDLLGWTEEELLGRPWIEYLPARIRDRMTQQLAGIAVRSGGSVGVYTELGHGSSFKVYLPRAEGEGTVAEAAPPALRRVGAQTVLVVEDADGLRLLAKRLLERQGYKVLVAADAKEALQV